MTSIKKKQSGFTIIEVLIVLAIAGLIMLIVFLAVPALQRNSRNTQRKNDVSGLLGAINEWSSNNNGQLPTTTAQQAAALSNVQLGIYTEQVTWGTSWPADANGAVVAINQKCNGEDALTAQNRAVSVLYRVESGTGGTNPQQCEGS